MDAFTPFCNEKELDYLNSTKYENKKFSQTQSRFMLPRDISNIPTDHSLHATGIGVIKQQRPMSSYAKTGGIGDKNEIAKKRMWSAKPQTATSQAALYDPTSILEFRDDDDTEDISCEFFEKLEYCADGKVSEEVLEQAPFLFNVTDEDFELNFAS